MNTSVKQTNGQISYGQILKSSAIIASSSMLNIVIGVVRTKIVAVLLGPSGVGLLGMYGSIVDLTNSIAGMGVSNSGVRQIAEAIGVGDESRIGRAMIVLRQVSILLGLLGAGLLLIFSKPIATFTFGSDQHVAAISMLSIAVFFRLIADGRGALIQGMRRVADLARMGVLSTLFGTALSVPILYLLHEKGIIYSIITGAATAFIISWWYSRKLEFKSSATSIFQMRKEVISLLKLGFAFMASSLMMMGSAYAIRLMVVQELGLEAAGFYQAAWALGGLYIGIILQSMGADFYPRLTAIASNNIECNQLVNEQIKVSLLLGGPGVIATLTFTSIVISLLYTTEFTKAVDVLRWICLGMALRIISWPMGFILLAKNAQKLFFWSELAWTIVHITLAWVFIGYFSLAGAGIAFFFSYIFHGILIFLIVCRLSGFSWSPSNRKIAQIFFFLISLVFSGFYLLPYWLATTLGVLASVLSGIYSIRSLLSLVCLYRIPDSILNLLKYFRLLPITHSKIIN